MFFPKVQAQNLSVVNQIEIYWLVSYYNHRFVTFKLLNIYISHLIFVIEWIVLLCCILLELIGLTDTTGWRCQPLEGYVTFESVVDIIVLL